LGQSTANSASWYRREKYFALLNVSRFTPFLDGVDHILPTGEHIFMKITSITPVPPRMFQVFNFAFFAEMSAGGITEKGYAEADTEILAIEKAISEASERVLFRVLKGSRYGTRTSSGWAAHLDPARAENAALMELLERDAALVHWFRKEAFYEIQYVSLPRRVQRWATRWLRGSPFPRLRVLMSRDGFIPTLSTALVDDRGYGVISHAAAESIETALYKALAETARLARMSLGHRYYESSRGLFVAPDSLYSFGPSEHAVAYSHHERMPAWIFGAELTASKAQRSWNQHWSRFRKAGIPYKYVPILNAPLAVGYCISPAVQALFFGKTQDALVRGDLNIARLEQTEEDCNFLPHFVA
jgi:hypothetical protein